MKKATFLIGIMLSLAVIARAADDDTFTIDECYIYQILSETDHTVKFSGIDIFARDIHYITIPAEVSYNGTTYSVTEISAGAFSPCYSLMSIVVEEGNKNYTSIDGVLYSIDKKTLCAFPQAKVEGFYEYHGRYYEFIIPETVTQIGDYAFCKCDNMLLTIPNSVTSIGNHAFNSCGLTSIIIPNSVTTIGDYAFYYCRGLTSITIPNSVTTIGNHAFSTCPGLTSITIPNSVTTIGSGAFFDCKQMTSIILPNSVTSIGEQTFFGCEKLTSISIPNSVKAIGDETFYECNGLTSISMPSSITSIGYRAFYDCRSLTSIKIPKSVMSIGKDAFGHCNSLFEFSVEEGNEVFSSVDGVLYTIDKQTLYRFPLGRGDEFSIPDFVTTIGEEAFWDCKNLTSVTIPNSITAIGDYAFGDCRALVSVTNSNSLTSIGKSAFYNCNSLASITIPNSVTTIGANAFEYCKSLTSVILPNSITAINRCTFRYCNGLTSVTIPASVTFIGRDAFYYCNSLKTIYSYPTVPPVPDKDTFYKDTFYKVPEDVVVYVPKGKIEDYSSAEGWNYFTDFREMDGEAGIVSIDADNSVSSTEYFNLNGTRTSGNFLTPGLYIKREGGKTSKILVR